jgi:hypothetical protein
MAMQVYFITVSDLYRKSAGDISGETVQIAILADGVEIDRLCFSGKNCQFNFSKQ